MSNPPTDFLKLAQEHYQAGRLPEAAALFQQIVAQQPDAIEALTWLALIAEQQGHSEASVAYYQRILSLKPDAAEVYSNLGSLLGRQGNVREAIAHHQRAVALKPHDADTHYNFGVILHQAGQIETAMHHYQQAVQLDPSHVSAHTNLGLTLYKQGNLEQAALHYRQAIARDPTHTNAHNGLGVVLYHLGQLDAAQVHCQQAIDLDPGSFSARNNLGTVLQKQGKLAEAKAQYQQAIALNPNYASAYDNLGTIFQEQKNLEEAIAHYRRAIELEPASANAYNNLGSALKEQGQVEDAIACCREAIRLQPSHADAHNNYGSSLVDQGKFEDAIVHFEQTIRYKPDHANAHLNLGIILLMLGNFQRGFQEYHWRWQTRQCPDLRYTQALWDGSDLNGKIILLTAEQGFGDTIQFARYAPLVAQKGGCVVIACQKQLLRILDTLPGIDRCVDRDQVNVQTHVHAPLLDLPLLLGTTLETIPAQVPYLTPPSDTTITLPTPHPTPPPTFKIGIVWASNPDSSTSKKRSCPLEHFVTLADIPGVQLYSLQKDITDSDRDRLTQSDIPDVGAQLQDFADTAAAIAQLDLVISVDTAVAHLAGSLAQPVWTLLPHVADWRWLTHREDSPWYPTMRLFRQPQPDDWQTVFAQVTTTLKATLTNPTLLTPPSLPHTPHPTTPPSPPFKTCRHGILLPPANHSSIEQSLELYGEWREAEVALFTTLLKPGNTVIEVGSNIGTHTIVLAWSVGNTGKVIAFEPQRLTFQTLCANLALNHFTNTFCYPIALGDHADFMPIAISAAAPIAPGASRQSTQTPVEQVQVATLDSFAIAQCHLLRINVSRMAAAIIQGATGTLQRCQPALYLRCDRPDAAAPLIQTLNAIGYNLYWHRFPLYNPNNFRQTSHNLFGDAIGTNLLGFHRDQNITVSGMEVVEGQSGKEED